jgi:hypothetical protein
MLLKKKPIYLLCLFLSIATFFSCGDINAVNNYEVTISSPEFVRVGQRSSFLYPNGRELTIDEYVLILDPVNEFTFGDTMAIRCIVKNPIWNNDGNINRPIKPPIVAKVTSYKTGNLQYVTFVQDPFGWGSVAMVGIDISVWPYIAYISSVKHDELNEIPGPKLLPDPTKQELKISSNGDVLTVEITYKDQILTKTIIVKGE